MRVVAYLRGHRLLMGNVLAQTMRLTVGLEREEDGRWIAEVVDLPGVLVYGSSREEALAAAQALALRVLADKLEYGETSLPLALSFDVTAA